jgi:hypothetical protein
MVIDYVFKAVRATVNATTAALEEPNTLHKALRTPEADQWLLAVRAELRQLLEAGAFSFVPSKGLPKRPISSRWVLKRKIDQAGEITKYKARFVVRGFEQSPGIDFTETFAATTIPPTWRVLLALAAAHNWEIEQIDFIGAFLNGDLSETIYIRLPELLRVLLEDPTLLELAISCGYNPAIDQVLLLLQALYGLKQAPRMWQEKLFQMLESLGFKALVSDASVHYQASSGTFIVTYVDDCLLIGPNLQHIQQLKETIDSFYSIEDRGPVAWFLGAEIKRDRPNRKLYLSQPQYIQQALVKLNLLDIKTTKVPLQPGISRMKPPTTFLSPAEHHYYMVVVGTANYLMLISRPDIAFTCQWLARHMQKPSKAHLSAAIGLFKYLKSTIDLALCYGATESTDYYPTVASDSDYAGCPVTARSTWGYLTRVAGAAVSWKAKLSTTVALSTLEAEYIALTEAVKEALWLLGLYSEINLPIQGPITIYGDNTGSISTAKDPKHHQRTKHTLVKFQFVREAQKANLVDIVYLQTSEIPADGLTKPLTPTKQADFQLMLGLRQLKASSAFEKGC